MAAAAAVTPHQSVRRASCQHQSQSRHSPLISSSNQHSLTPACCSNTQVRHPSINSLILHRYTLTVVSHTNRLLQQFINSISINQTGGRHAIIFFHGINAFPHILPNSNSVAEKVTNLIYKFRNLQ